MQIYSNSAQQYQHPSSLELGTHNLFVARVLAYALGRCRNAACFEFKAYTDLTHAVRSMWCNTRRLHCIFPQ